ncbi:MAG: FHA domain-containing protein, partial [Geminicoccaceae bacterium]
MSFTVFIETGLHAGAVQRLEPGLYTIGSEPDSDIVLSDPDVEPVHAILEFDEAGLRLEPARGKVSVHGETGQLEPGDERYLSLPAGFSIGDTAISIRAPKDAVRTRNRQRYAIGAMAAAVVGIIGLYT